jgi:RNA polymerase sigma-70 factor (ECF subfamily)
MMLEGLSMREIADVIGLTEPNVKVKIHRIKENLKQQLNNLKQ